MDTSPLDQLRDIISRSDMTPDSSRRALFTQPVPATQIHGTAPENQTVLQSDFVQFQASVYDQMAHMNETLARMTELLNSAASPVTTTAASPATTTAASSATAAASSAITAAGSPATTTAASSAKTGDDHPPTTTSTTTQVSGAPKPSTVMLATQNYAVTNPSLFENDGRTKIGTPSTAVERIKKLKPGVWDEFEKIERPGLQAELAIDNLKHESLAVFPAMRDCDWAGSLVEALTLDPARSRATMVQNLLKVAVRCGTVELIDAQITQINATGLFDRKLATAGDIRLEHNFQLFDTATYDGQLLWDATGRMITAYLSRSRSSEQAKERAERTYAELQCDSHEDVSIFLCTEADCYDNLVRSKAFYSDYTRVGLVLKKLPGHLQAAYTAFKTRRKESGEWSDARGTDFDLFATEIEIIAMAMPSDCCDEQGDQAEPAPDDCNSTHAERPRATRKPGRTTSSDHCWNHQFVGECRFGPDCRNTHVGTAGSLKHEVCDAQGRCRLELKAQGTCRRNNCPFLHPAGDTTGEKPLTKMYPLLPRREPEGECTSSPMMYHIKHCPVY